MNHFKMNVFAMALLGFNAFCRAESVNIDIQGSTDGGPGYNMNIGTYSGMAAASDSGATWNALQFNNTSAASLLDGDGNVTDVDISLEGDLGEWSYSNANILMGDYTFSSTAWASGSGERFTLFSNVANGGSGLQITGTQKFDIYIYTMGDAASQHATFQLNHADGTTVQTATGDGPFSGTFTEGGNYVKFSNVTAKAYYVSETDNGYEFEFFWGHDGSGTAAINGIQIVKAKSGPRVALYIIK